MTRALRRTAFWLLWAVVLTVPWQGVDLLQSLGTPSRIIGVVAAVAGLTSLALDGRNHRLGPVHLLVLALAAWISISVLWSGAAGTGRAYAETFAELTLLVLLIWEFADLPGDASRLMVAYVAGCTLSSVGVITSSGTNAATVSARFTANGFNENDLGSMIALGVPIAAYLALRLRRRWSRALCVGFLPVGVTATLLTGSRGSLAVLAVALLMVPSCWAALSRAQRGFGVGVLGVTALAVVQLVPATTFTRLAQIEPSSAGTLTGRAQLWRASARIVNDHPWFGVGAGSVPDRIGHTTGVLLGSHDTFLSLAAGTGFIGLALFVAVLVTAGMTGATMRGLDRGFVVVLLVALIVALLPLHWELQKAVWIVVALVPVLARQQLLRAAASSGSSLRSKAG